MDCRQRIERAHAVADAQIHLGTGSSRSVMGGSVELDTETTRGRGSRGPRLAVCLVSGGMDSCVTAAIAQEENDELAFLHASYGQRTEQRELRIL